MSRLIRSIAMIDPFGDYGIGGYTHELSEGLAANNIQVDVYTSGMSIMQDLELSRRHRLLPVLGSVLFRQKKMVKGESSAVGLRPEVNSSVSGQSRKRSRCRNALVPTLRGLVLPLELALYLKRNGYDLVWTQWPVMDGYGIRFWTLSKSFGMRLVHTVHDVLPHERMASYEALCQRIYRKTDALIVHSNFSRRELSRYFPEVKDNQVIMARMGVYSMYARQPEVRQQVRRELHIREDQVAVLFFGSVRPYKNIESVLMALREERLREVVLVVAGREFGYPDTVPGDLLGRTRRLAENLGVLDRVRLVPGIHDLTQTAHIFEAADILVQPYLESYGSALLLLGMTFGKYIVATATGGMDEYLSYYPWHRMLEGPDSAHVAHGLSQAIQDLRRKPMPSSIEIPELKWPHIAKGILSALEGQLSS